jgi:hypothetical protein
MPDDLAGWNDGETKSGILQFDYTAGAEQALEQARKDGWTIASIKNDWATVCLQSDPPATLLSG